MHGDPTKKEARKEKRRLKKLNAPPLNLPEAPFYIDKDGNEYSRERYMSEFGTTKYTQSALDNYMGDKSNNKRRRKRTKIKK